MRSSHIRNDVESGERARGGDGGAAQAREVVAVGVSDPLDQTQPAQATELARQRRRRHVQASHEIGAAQAVDVELGALKRAQQSLLACVEEVQSLDRASAPRLGSLSRARSRSPLEVSSRAERNSR